MDHHAKSVPLPKFPLSAYDLSHPIKTQSQAGLMNCHLVEECIPGDIAHIKTDLFMRLDPLTFPIMHKIKIRQNFFFVPTRLVLGDKQTEEFFSCKDMMAKLPYILLPPNSGYSSPIGKNSLFDEMENQPIDGVWTTPKIIRNPLPFYMYSLIWKDWYADEILDSTEIAVVENLIDSYQNTSFGQAAITFGPGTRSPLELRRVSYSKDRFTSAQPDAQRVGEVYLMNPLKLEGVRTGDEYIGQVTSGSGNLLVLPYGQTVPSGGTENVRASLTIDELWDEMVVQRFLNSMNEFGNERYTEILAGQFGVLSADARLQRPQWLGGNETVVNISEVLQTSESTSNNPLGSLAGRGIVSGRGRDIAFKVPEHGFIFGILTIVPENGYASGSPRWLYKSTPLDFAFPRFNNLGESVVFNGELFSDHEVDSSTQDLSEFGYQPQFDEYRSHPGRATCGFRDSAFLSWHLDRKFTSIPALNSSFIHIDPQETNRIFNDTDANAYHYNIVAFHKEMFVRPIVKHPRPGASTL